MTSTEKLCSYGGAIALALLLRSVISLHGHSGEGIAPMYGDYEAQRHWQEVTANLPIQDWYRNTSDNDLMYWGLDYPPLTAYHSFALGKVAQRINESYVKLHESRGISSPEHKYFMRWSVLLADILIYIPAIYVATQAACKLTLKKATNASENVAFISTLLSLIYPGQILIDNGHFQYNNVSLGLMLFAVACIIYDRRFLAAILFCLALNYKQMELYHALPFFAYLLRDCFSGKRQSFWEGVGNLFALSVVVLVTFTIVWIPWISSADSLLAVVQRIFPIARGVFEDKVANIWCVANVFVKFKERYSNERMALICMGSTLVASLPSCLHLFFVPDKTNFLYSLVNVASAFFLFSFQVHEKSILLVAAPVLLLTSSEPLVSQWFAMISVYSMFPLLEKDKLGLAFTSSMVVYFSVLYVITSIYGQTKSKSVVNGRKQFVKILFLLSNFLAVCLIVCYLFVKPPAKLPHLYSLLISAYCCIHFISFFIYFNIKQMFRHVCKIS